MVSSESIPSVISCSVLDFSAGDQLVGKAGAEQAAQAQKVMDNPTSKNVVYRIVNLIVLMISALLINDFRNGSLQFIRVKTICTTEIIQLFYLTIWDIHNIVHHIKI